MITVIINVHKYLMKNIVNASSDTECVSLNYKQCLTQSTLISLHRNEYSLVLSLDRCVGSCNIFNDLSNRVFVPNKKKI